MALATCGRKQNKEKAKSKKVQISSYWDAIDRTSESLLAREAARAVPEAFQAMSQTP